MSVCHLHVLIANRTARDASQCFRDESKPHHAAAPPSAAQGAVGAPCAEAVTSSVPGTARVGHACAGGRCWKEATGGKARGN